MLVLSRAAEQKFFPRGDALGKELSFGARMGYDKLQGEVVGIVGDVHDFGLDQEPPPDAYLLADQSGISDLSVVVRSAGRPRTGFLSARSSTRRGQGFAGYENVHYGRSNGRIAGRTSVLHAASRPVALSRYHWRRLEFTE